MEPVPAIFSPLGAMFVAFPPPPSWREGEAARGVLPGLTAGLGTEGAFEGLCCHGYWQDQILVHHCFKTVEEF